MEHIYNRGIDVVSFFNGLKESDWDVFATKKWRVKDLLSHLVGWEREVDRELVKVFETGNEPWFMSVENYDDFNERVYQEFKQYSPKLLISELEMWRDALGKEIRRIGEDKIRQRPRMSWVFDEGGEPHFEHHMRQVDEALRHHAT